MSETVDMRGGENAVVAAEGGARNMLSTVRKFFAEPGVQRSIPTAAAALLVFFGLMAYLFLQQPERTTLYASLPENEKARIVDALKNANVDVALDPSSGEVLVPTNDFHRSRILLAAQGLPASMPDGYKQLEDMPMGTSRSVENMRLKHSQEIELARSISEIDSIVSTRVHLAIPEKSVFVRNNRNRPPLSWCRWQMAAYWAASRLTPLCILYRHPCRACPSRMSRLLTKTEACCHKVAPMWQDA